MNRPRILSVHAKGTFYICLMVSLIVCSDARSDDAKTPLAIGQKAIDFELPTVGADDYITLEDEYDKGPVVVIFLRGYPGHQSPLCSQQVNALSNRARAISQFAQRVIMIYPGPRADLARHAEAFLGSKKLPAPLVLVRDDGLKTVDQWGLRWNKPRETTYPATYVINKNGRVAWSKISSSHAGRSTVEEILTALKKL